MKMARLLVAAVLAVVIVAGGTIAQDKPEKLGAAQFQTSCSPTAQQAFDRALAMLHSFWFPQAPKAFEAITQTDADCAIAYWGIAMSQRGNPLVGAPSPAASKARWAAVEKAKAIVDRPELRVAKAFVAAR